MATTIMEPHAAGVTLISTAEAAEILGMSRQYVHRLAASGKLPSARRGARLAFSEECVRARLADQAHAAALKRRDAMLRPASGQAAKVVEHPARARRCPLCACPVVEAPLRVAPGVRQLVEPGELTPRGPCARCGGAGTSRLDPGGRCRACGGAGVTGVAIPEVGLIALDSFGRARPIRLADRKTGDALHLDHAAVCAAELARPAAA